MTQETGNVGKTDTKADTWFDGGARGHEKKGRKIIMNVSANVNLGPIPDPCSLLSSKRRSPDGRQHGGPDPRCVGRSHGGARTGPSAKRC
jgi:hypothetical protein